MNPPITVALGAAILRVEDAIRGQGYTLTYRPWVEDSKSPGILGMIAGRTAREDREVVIGTKATPSPILRLRVLKHELRHITDPDWDCGCRAMFDRRPVPAARDALVR